MSNNFVTWIAKLLLLSLEIFRIRSFLMIYTVTIMACGVVSLLGSIVGFFYVIEITEKIVGIVGVSAQLNGILLFLAVFVYREKLLVLFDKLEKEQDNVDVKLNRAEVLIKKKMVGLFITIVSSGAFFIVPPLIINFFEGSFNDKFSLLIPFWYSCGGRDSNTRFCWDVTTSTRTIVQAVNVYQATSLSLHTLAYILSFTLYGLMVGELEMHMEIISKKVDQFNEVAKEANRDHMYGTDSQIMDAEEKMYQHFLHIIKYQKFLYRCVAEALVMWKLYVSYYYATAFFDTTLLFFGMIALMSNQKLLAIRAFGLIVIKLLMALIVAYYSQNISYLNEDFLNIMSRIQWYNRRNKFCKTYHQVLTFHQTSNVMKLAGVVELNLNCYARLLRNIYSVVNVMYLMFVQ